MNHELITKLDIYWLTRCDYIQTACFVLAFLTAIAAVLLWVAHFASKYDSDCGKVFCKTSYKFLIPLNILFPLFIIAACAVPRTSEMAAIIVIPAIANNENVQDLGQGVVDLAKDWLQELKPHHKEAK